MVGAMRGTVVALFLALLPGCGTLFFHNPQEIRVTSNVPGSLVIAKDEGILGKTDGLSGEFQLDRSHDHTVLVSAHGNEAATIQVRSHFSWWRILISLGGDIPLGVIPFPPVVWGVVEDAPRARGPLLSALRRQARRGVGEAVPDLRRAARRGDADLPALRTQVRPEGGLAPSRPEASRGAPGLGLDP